MRASESRGGFKQLLGDRAFVPYALGESVSSFGDAMSEVAIVLIAMAAVEIPAKGAAVAAATIAYLLPGLLTGTLLSRRLTRLSPARLLLIDSVWRFSWFTVIAVLHAIQDLSLPTLIACLAAAALTKPAGSVGARAIIPLLVPPVRYLHANSLLGLVAQGATMFGPALAGLIAAVWSPVTALTVDGASFLALGIGVLIASRYLSRSASAHSVANHDAEESPRRTPTPQLLRLVMPVFATTGFFHILYGGFVVALPLLASAQGAQDGGARLLGVMWSLFGVGAVASGVLTPRFPGLVRPRVLPIMALGWGVCMCVIALAGSNAVMALAMLVGGLAYGPYAAVVSTLFQRDLPATAMMEVSGYYGALTSSASPLGIMFAGLASSAMTPTAIMASAGGALALIGLTCTALLWTRAGLGPEGLNS